MPTKYDFKGCTSLTSCRLNSVGWNDGFVRCDYCLCECAEPVDERTAVVVTGKVSTDEEALYGTCTGDCQQSGIVRTDFEGWQVSNCALDKVGYTSGFVRCDYCTCVGTNRKYAASYTLKNVSEVWTRVVSRGVSLPLDSVRPGGDLGLWTPECPRTQVDVVKLCFTLQHANSPLDPSRSPYTVCRQPCVYERAAPGGAARPALDENVESTRERKYTMTLLQQTRKSGGNDDTTVLGQATVNNCASTPQTVSRTITLSGSESTTVSTSASIVYGLTITVTAGVTTESQETSSWSDVAQAQVDVPAFKKQEVIVVGSQGKTDIPYTATLVTTFDDGTTAEEEDRGVLSAVSYGTWDITYPETKQADKSSTCTYEDPPATACTSLVGYSTAAALQDHDGDSIECIQGEAGVGLDMCNNDNSCLAFNSYKSNGIPWTCTKTESDPTGPHSSTSANMCLYIKKPLLGTVFLYCYCNES
eukprot:gene6155-2767_t